jgi:hypothetical protein
MSKFKAGINIRTRTRNEHGEYILGEIRDMWSGFNLALDSIEIDLPNKRPISNGGGLYEVARNGTINGCSLLIEALNLGLKIK